MYSAGSVQEVFCIVPRAQWSQHFLILFQMCKISIEHQSSPVSTMTSAFLNWSCFLFVCLFFTVGGAVMLTVSAFMWMNNVEQLGFFLGSWLNHWGGIYLNFFFLKIKGQEFQPKPNQNVKNQIRYLSSKSWLTWTCQEHHFIIIISVRNIDIQLHVKSI